jgi:hypothetical protein
VHLTTADKKPELRDLDRELKERNDAWTTATSTLGSCPSVAELAETLAELPVLWRDQRSRLYQWDSARAVWMLSAVFPLGWHLPRGLLDQRGTKARTTP